MIERHSSWKYVYNWLSHKFGFELRKKHDMKGYMRGSGGLLLGVMSDCQHVEWTNCV
jgi:hypothetical protein